MLGSTSHPSVRDIGTKTTEHKCTAQHGVIQFIRYTTPPSKNG